MSSRTSQDVVICLKDVNVVYGNLAALYEINVDIYKGDFLGICGPNGSGKTTLLKTIMGLLKPLTGQVALFGNKVGDKIPKETKFKFGYVPQISDIDRNFPALVRDVVEMGRYAKAGVGKSS
ncbi:MAG: ATP-binding cassette domain-containing protein, partial [Candidatus Heimdallarchaeota archaeon]|nr:ATP-binding cassette domain-containing protein [Candidatus Heimdallarchaeota archaeon]MCK5142869.1 ATP-binding cassette domain-containing protein [Candidatus Heimdallarchaeota archaeon]